MSDERCKCWDEPGTPDCPVCSKIEARELAGPSGSVMTATENGIKEIRYLCEEALDHQMGWKSFCEMVKRRLEIETAFVEMSSRNDQATRPESGRVSS